MVRPSTSNLSLLFQTRMLVLVLVLVLGGGELGSLAWLGAFDLAARGGVALR